MTGDVPPADPVFPKEVHNLLVVAQQGHLSLSAMADTKASTLMAATFVVFTLTIGQITTDRATLSLLLLGIFSFISTICSVLAIRPTLARPAAGLTPGANIVFFGAFAGVPENVYIDHIIDVLKSEEATYRAMARDLYQNGRILYFKKYRYLSYAYTTFLVGLGATLAAFCWELAKAHR